MEVVDKNRISQVKVAAVCEIIGKRLHVKYYDSSPEDNGFWCHEDSPLIHPVGWAFRIGHPLDAPQSYCQRVAAGRLLSHDTTPEMFYKYPSDEPPLFSEGMKLEAIDPLNLSSVCAATVMQILNEGYMMIRIDCYPADESGADWFCYHQRSPCIFPVGFAMANNIPLVPPTGYTAERFTWEEYLSRGGSAAPACVFAARGHVVAHGFVAGMRLECADLMDPRLVCVATVARVVADLLKVHFDGWGAEYDQWLWAHSTDMYPVGWCRAVRHRLEGPLQPPRAPRRLPPRAPRRRRKTGTKTQIQPPSVTEDSSQNSDMGDAKSNSDIGDAKSNSDIADVKSNSDIADVKSNSDIGDAKSYSDIGDAKSYSDIGDVKSYSDIGDAKSYLDIGDAKSYSDIGDTKSLSPPTSLSETSADVDAPTVPDDVIALTPTMDIDVKNIPMPGEELKDIPMPDDPPVDALGDLGSNLDFISPPTESSQDSSENPPLSPELPAEEVDDKVIPRLVNNTVPLDVLNAVDPENWSTSDVARFLTVNDCQPYCDNFANITGPMMLQLSKDEIIELLQMKVGPSLKIFDLIQQLKCKIKQPQCRMSFK